MTIQTHEAIEHSLSGTPVEWSPGRATLRMETTEVMAADERGLIHGGFVFSLADHAAMVAVNHPHVVLGSAEVTFLRPVTVGTLLEAVAEVAESTGKKHSVAVVVHSVGEEGPVFEGEFLCFVPNSHVLDRGQR